MNVAVSHLIPAPFVQQVARALYEHKMLGTFYCSLVDLPHSAVQRTALALAARFSGVDVMRQFARRRVTEVPPDYVRSYPTREMIRMIATKTLHNQLLDDLVFHWARDGFDRWVASYIRKHDAVYGYEYGCRDTLLRAKSEGKSRVYDVPSPEHDYVERLLAPEFERFPLLRGRYRRRVERKHVERTERRRHEWNLANLVVANSEFTALSWQRARFDEKPVVVVPYGAPPVTNAKNDEHRHGPLRLLWAGTFSVRKGAHYVVDALQQIRCASAAVKLDVYGSVTLPPDIVAAAPPQIQFRGSVPRTELFAAMLESDALLFPTLCDGFGLVVTEAFAHGLPVITTNRAGASALVRHGVNGFIIDPGSTSALQNIVERCLDNRESLVEMRASARAAAAAWQWSHYRAAIAKAVASLEKQ